MNIYIMADMEGISGIVNPEQVNTKDGKYYNNEGRRYMTWDVNACVRGCLAGGAEKVIVRDAHAGGRNLVWEELCPDAVYVTGASGDRRMPGIEECDGVILLGYHAMAGTPGGILEHTWSSAEWQNLWINGVLSGETALDAGIAADYGKPVIMVSGDDKVCAEARRLISDIVTAQVKQGMTLTGGTLLSMEAAHRLIYEMSCEAVKKCTLIKPWKAERPVTMRLECVERIQLPSVNGKPWLRIIDGRTFEVSGNTFEEALFRL